jgi:hypothetical protein
MESSCGWHYANNHTGKFQFRLRQDNGIQGDLAFDNGLLIVSNANEVTAFSVVPEPAAGIYSLTGMFLFASIRKPRWRTTT